MDEKPIKIDCILTKNKVFLRLDWKSYLVNGQTPKSTHQRQWFYVDGCQVDSIVRVLPSEQTNQRFVLKDGFPSTDRIPAEILGSCLPEQYDGVADLYEYKFDPLPPKQEIVHFELNVLSEMEQFDFIKALFNPNYSLLDRIQIHPLLLQERPCWLDGDILYRLVTEHIDIHIDKSVALIKGDMRYPPFSIYKKVRLATPLQVKINKNDSLFGRKKKATWIEKSVEEREILVMKIANDPKSQHCLPTIYGENLSELQENLNVYLEDLMLEINTPYQECQHCNGLGIIRYKEEGVDHG